MGKRNGRIRSAILAPLGENCCERPVARTSMPPVGRGRNRRGALEPRHGRFMDPRGSRFDVFRRFSVGWAEGVRLKPVVGNWLRAACSVDGEGRLFQAGAAVPTKNAPRKAGRNKQVRRSGVCTRTKVPYCDKGQSSLGYTGGHVIVILG